MLRVGNGRPDVQRWMPDRPSGAGTKFPCIPEIPIITDVRLRWPATAIIRQKVLPGTKPAGRVPDVSRPTMRCALRGS